MHTCPFAHKRQTDAAAWTAPWIFSENKHLLIVSTVTASIVSHPTHILSLRDDLLTPQEKAANSLRVHLKTKQIIGSTKTLPISVDRKFCSVSMSCLTWISRPTALEAVKDSSTGAMYTDCFPCTKAGSQESALTPTPPPLPPPPCTIWLYSTPLSLLPSAPSESQDIAFKGDNLTLHALT